MTLTAGPGQGPLWGVVPSSDLKAIIRVTFESQMRQRPAVAAHTGLCRAVTPAPMSPRPTGSSAHVWPSRAHTSPAPRQCGAHARIRGGSRDRMLNKEKQESPKV